MTRSDRWPCCRCRSSRGDTEAGSKQVKFKHVMERIVSGGSSFPFPLSNFIRVDCSLRAPGSQPLSSSGPMGAASHGGQGRGLCSVPCLQTSGSGPLGPVFSLGGFRSHGAVPAVLHADQCRHQTHLLRSGPFTPSFPLSQGHARTRREKSRTKTLIFAMIHCPHRPWPYDGGTPGDRPLSVSSLPTGLQSDGDATAQLMGTPPPASPTAGPFCRFRAREMFPLVPFSTCSDDKQTFWQQTNPSQLKITHIAVPVGVGVAALHLCFHVDAHACEQEGFYYVTPVGLNSVSLP